MMYSCVRDVLYTYERNFRQGSNLQLSQVPAITIAIAVGLLGPAWLGLSS